MSIEYQYSTNDGSTWNDIGDAGFSDLVRIRTNADVDRVTMRKTGKTTLTDADVFAYGADIWIRTWDGSTGTLWFRGKVETSPRVGTWNNETQQVTIAGPWRELERCTYQQSWKVYDTSGEALTNVNKTRVVLMQDDTGSRITAGAQIGDAIDWAISKGAAIQKGTIDAGPELPYDERENLSCAEVILTMMRWLPDYVAWIDYTTSPPTFNCRQRTNLSAASKAITDGELLDITPLHDRTVSGVHITYEQTHDVDGAVYRTINTDTAGTTTAIDTVFATFDLEGSSRTYVRQKVVTGDLPTPVELDSDKAFLKEMIPALAEIDDADLTIDDASFDVVSLPARYLKEGPLPEWVDNNAEEITFTWKISATIKNDASEEVEEVTGKVYKAQVIGTSATSKTYQRLTSFDSGEPVPTGVAAALYAAWNTLEYQGQFQFTLRDCPGSIGPGNKFNLTSGLSAWTSMNALVRQCTEYVDEGRTVIDFGPPRQLEADTLLGIFRATRARRFSWSRSSRTTGTTNGSGEVEIGGKNPAKTASESKGENKSLRLKDTVGTDDHQIKLDPALVAFADSGNKAAQTIQPREQVILYDDSGTLKAKLAQVMSGAPYGTEQNIPLGLPADPATPATIGDTDEGSEAADTTTWAASAGAGVQLHFMTRVAYYDAGNETLYGYVRTAKFDKFGRLASISAETRVTIDVPEL